MAGVADHDDSASMPRAHWRTLEERPFRHFSFDAVNEMLAFLVKAAKGRAQLLLAAVCPRYGIFPFFQGAGHEIELLAAVGEKIDDQMSIGRPPLGMVVEAQIPEISRRDPGAMADVAGVDRLLRSEQPLSHLRKYAVGPDHQIGAGGAAVGKFETHA